MKKSFFLAAMSLIGLLATAQVKVSAPWPEFPVTFKRCIVQDGNGYIDLLIANNAKEDYKIGMQGIQLYDDEGNCYTEQSRNIQVVVFGGTTKGECLIPSGTVVKARINFTRLDEYATMFTKAVITMYHQLPIPGYVAKKGTLSIARIPITRRDQ